MLLIDDLLLSPVRGFRFILKQIQSMVERELDDESLLKEQLLELELRRELEEVSEEEFRERQEDLFARLRAIKGRKLEEMQRAHTAETASFVIEAAEEEEEFDRSNERERS